MPFGLKNAASTWQILVNEILQDLLYQGVLVYLDDILIYTKTEEEHIRLVREVLKRLLENKLYVKLSKCEFHVENLDYLGFRVGTEGVRMDPGKVRAVTDWETPVTRKEAQSFLGFANFYRKFIPDFAEIALPITNALKTKNSPDGPKARAPSYRVKWDSDCQKAFALLKSKFAAEPVLALPDTKKQFIVQVDASDVAVGAVLLQRDSAGDLRPCAYFSRKFSPEERNYPVWERESLAMKLALEHWRHFLQGASETFEVWTDHKNLEVLSKPRRLNPKHVRWAKLFHEFDFVIKYFPGKQNFLADALSRLPQHQSVREETIASLFSPKHLAGAAVTRSQAKATNLVPSELKQRFLDEVPSDPWISDHKNEVDWTGGLPFKEGRVCVPAVLKTEILRIGHDSKVGGHWGFLKTYHWVRKRFWWPKLKTDVEAYCGECEVCHKIKPASGKPQGLLKPLEVPSRPWEHISMDFIVDLPPSENKDAIWVITDLFSRQAHFIPCKGPPPARTMAKMFIKEVVRLHGVPKRCVTDRDVRWTSSFWKEMFHGLGISQCMSSAFHPQSDGSTEILNQVVQKYLRAYVNEKQNNWAELLPLAEFSYNNAVHSSTKRAPFEVVYGTELPCFPDLEPLQGKGGGWEEWSKKISGSWVAVSKALEHAKLTQKRMADKHRQPAPPYQIGDQVYLSSKNLKLDRPCKKLSEKFLGPFVIKKVVNDVAVELDLPKEMGFITGSQEELEAQEICKESAWYFKCYKLDGGKNEPAFGTSNIKLNKPTIRLPFFCYKLDIKPVMFNDNLTDLILYPLEFERLADAMISLT